jgi:acyl transferase domain-containing protein
MGSYPETNLLPSSEPIAIVGSSCRFPGGTDSPSKLWSLLKNPQDIVQEIPSSRFDTKGFCHKDSQHHGVSPSTPLSLVTNINSMAN